MEILKIAPSIITHLFNNKINNANIWVQFEKRLAHFVKKIKAQELIICLYIIEALIIPRQLWCTLISYGDTM